MASSPSIATLSPGVMLVRCTLSPRGLFLHTLIGALGSLCCRSAMADPPTACPDGWFCEPPPEAEAPPPVPTPPPTHAAPSESDHAAGVMEFTPDITLPAVADGYEPEPARSDRFFGVQARIAVPLIDDGDSPAHPFMAGPGLGLVFLPLEHVGLELAVDSAFGRDALDAKRRELAASGALLAFFDTHQLVQVFLSTGLFHSWADVEPRGSHVRDYRYFGAFLGLGAELTFHPLYSVFLRVDGFMRGRADGGAGKQPEFVHQTSGEMSNSSAGALLRLGAARYF